jgi:hypothetical protein
MALASHKARSRSRPRSRSRSRTPSRSPLLSPAGRRSGSRPQSQSRSRESSQDGDSKAVRSRSRSKSRRPMPEKAKPKKQTQKTKATKKSAALVSAARPPSRSISRSRSRSRSSLAAGSPHRVSPDTTSTSVLGPVWSSPMPPAEQGFECKVWGIVYAPDEMRRYLAPFHDAGWLATLTTRQLCDQWQKDLTMVWVDLRDRVDLLSRQLDGASAGEIDGIAANLEIAPRAPTETTLRVSQRIVEALAKRGPPWYSRAWYRTTRWTRGIWNWLWENPKTAGAIALAAAAILGALMYSRTGRPLTPLESAQLETSTKELASIANTPSVSDTPVLAPTSTPPPSVPSVVPPVVPPSVPAEPLATSATVWDRIQQAQSIYGTAASRRDQWAVAAASPAGPVAPIRRAGGGAEATVEDPAVLATHEEIENELIPQLAYLEALDARSPTGLNPVQRAEYLRLRDTIQRWRRLHPEKDTIAYASGFDTSDWMRAAAEKAAVGRGPRPVTGADLTAKFAAGRRTVRSRLQAQELEAIRESRARQQAWSARQRMRHDEL